MGKGAHCKWCSLHHRGREVRLTDPRRQHHVRDQYNRVRCTSLRELREDLHRHGVTVVVQDAADVVRFRTCVVCLSEVEVQLGE